jgi:hypothetical protein
METLHLTIDTDSPDVQLASAASGLSGEELVKEALALGLQALSKPKTTQVVPLTADEVRRRFLENRKRGVFTENGFTPEFEAGVVAASREEGTVYEGTTAEMLDSIYRKHGVRR